ncbi:MAG: Crp/Fnr family transcriptional regulator [Gaiellales bacterium]|nr:Crp/Fnr family transcriptional regulator [Gaiellales bacterium]
MTWVNVSKIPPNISLRAFPLFAGLEPDELAGVEGFTRRLPLSAGEALFQEGDRADRLFLIRSGRLKVFKSSPQGREQILSVLGPGEPVGEAAVFAGESFPAGAEALEASEVLAIPRRVLLDIVERKPEVAMKFIGSLARRLRYFTALVENLSLREVTERLASYVLYLDSRQMSQGHVDLELSRAQLAALFGTVPETLSRAFQRLARCGAISAERRLVRIEDRRVLEQQAWLQKD